MSRRAKHDRGKGRVKILDLDHDLYNRAAVPAGDTNLDRWQAPVVDSAANGLDAAVIVKLAHARDVKPAELLSTID